MRIIKDVNEIPENSRVFIYGAGVAGKSLFFYISRLREDIKVLGFIDSFKSGKYSGVKIYKFENFLKRFKRDDFDFILIASMFHDEISENLSKNNISKYTIINWKIAGISEIIEIRKFFTLKWKLKCFFLKLISKILPKSKKIVLVGEYGGNFVGNDKYFYLFLEKKSKDVYWLTNNKENHNFLKREGIKVIRYNNFFDFIKLFFVKFFVFDNRDLYLNYRGMVCFSKTYRIQLWHGVGFKKIGLMQLQKDFLDKLRDDEKKRLNERLTGYHFLITTSDFYAKEVFAPAFGLSLNKIPPLGYPRNDVFYSSIKGEEINTDKKLIERAKKFKKVGGKIIVFAPTFRDLDMKVDFRKVFDYKKLNEFLKENRMFFIIKGHSLPGIKFLLENISKYENISVYDNKKDIYPLLKITELLITDYSSIYTDFLHTGKPVLFYPFDYDEYTELHRQLQFDYNKMTPGPKARDFNELLHWIKHFVIEGKDGFEKERERIFNLAFNFKDGNSSERIYKKIISLK
jgi:CDP-glycerol glycerophosphotransferase